jgi:hypothetical protein
LQFDEFWSKAVSFLKTSLDQLEEDRIEKLFVSSWRAGRGFSDEKFPVRKVEFDKIICLSIHAGKAIEIPRNDMATLYTLWDDYIRGQLSRFEIVEKVPRTTYAISLMKFLKESIN